MTMKVYYPLIAALGALFLSSPATHADEPSAFGSGFDVQEFYRGFTLDEITPQNQQKWPYYRYVSAHWDKYAGHEVAAIKASSPAKLTVAGEDERLDLNTEHEDDRSFIESMNSTQVKGFVVMKDNRILAEFYDNGFNVTDTNLLQSAAKTYAAILVHQLIDAGRISLDANVESILPGFKGSSMGAATVQQVLDHTSGMPQLLDFHTPGALGQLWELEIGLQGGKTKGHNTIITETKANKTPGEAWQYCDMNTDTLSLIAEKVTGRKLPELLSDLFATIGAHHDGSIALTSDGTCSPCYGISTSARDYALFHQWIAQGNAPKSYYASVTDVKKSRFSETNPIANSTFPGVEYGSQSYYIVENDVIYSSGSYGQQGYSDMKTGVSVVFLSDWAVNWEVAKGNDNRYRAIAIINHLRASNPNYLRTE
jgi:CubicO group peptidase (beta-lactamase class C family)